MENLQDLCLSCGLCCDGSLFDLVKLEPGDNAEKLKALGLPITVSRGKNPVARFPQPCAALCKDLTCRVYTDRPWQCRKFECGVFKRAKAGQIESPQALRLVKKARRHANKIRQLLRELGDNDEHRAIGERFHRTSERLESSRNTTEVSSKYADLSLAVHHFKLLAYDKFYTLTEEPK